MTRTIHPKHLKVGTKTGAGSAPTSALLESQRCRLVLPLLRLATCRNEIAHLSGQESTELASTARACIETIFQVWSEPGLKSDDRRSELRRLASVLVQEVASLVEESSLPGNELSYLDEMTKATKRMLRKATF